MENFIFFGLELKPHALGPNGLCPPFAPHCYATIDSKYYSHMVRL